MTDEKANGHLVGLSQKPKSWDDFFASPVRITDDFMAECEQPKDQEREANDDFVKEHPDLLDDGPGYCQHKDQKCSQGQNTHAASRW